MLEKERRRPNFGNAGAVNNLLATAAMRMEVGLSCNEMCISSLMCAAPRSLLRWQGTSLLAVLTDDPLLDSCSSLAFANCVCVQKRLVHVSPVQGAEAPIAPEDFQSADEAAPSDPIKIFSDLVGGLSAPCGERVHIHRRKHLQPLIPLLIAACTNTSHKQLQLRIPF